MNRRRFLKTSLLGSVSLTFLSRTSLAALPLVPDPTNTCTLSPPVYEALEELTSATCNQFTPALLSAITDLELRHIHISQFQEHDFVDLKNLQSLNFYSLFHKDQKTHHPEIKAFTRGVFEPLKSLEKLTIDEALGLLDDDVFSELKNLKLLDLGFSTFKSLPKSLLEIQTLEHIYVDKLAVSESDYLLLKEAYGDRLNN
jgi:hypothetical protein